MSKGAEQELAVALAHMARDLLAQDTVQHTLDRICDHAVELVEGCEHAGILTLHGRQDQPQRRRVETLAVTSDLVRESDRIQAELEEGPCLDAAANLEPVYRIADVTSAEARWPRYAPKARELGVGSMLGGLPALSCFPCKPRNGFSRFGLAEWDASWEEDDECVDGLFPSPCSGS